MNVILRVGGYFMKYVTGDKFWTYTKSIDEKFEYLSENIECDVLIIGAGVTGALSAYYLADGNSKVVVVDKNLIGYKSTCISTAILQYEIDTDFVGLKGMRGEENAAKAFKLTEQSLHDINQIVNDLEDDCHFNYRDCFYYTNKNGDIKRLKKEFELRKKYGFDVEYIDEDTARKLFSFPVKAGIYTKGSSGEINPYKFTKALINKVKERGGAIYENTEIVNFVSDDKGAIAYTKNGFSIKCNKIIVAMGYESREFIKKRTAILSRTFTIVSQPVLSFNGWYNRCIIRNTAKPYTYFRSTQDNRIIIGGEDVDIGGERSRASNLTHDHLLSKDKYNKLETILKSMFPDITNIKIQYKFSGIFGETSDGLPYIGEYEDYPNCYFNLGYGSNGILYSALGAKMIKKLYYDNDRTDMGLFSFDR
ncbi:FAD-dependent oxidoreductase [Clostridiaceae bacterium M8S5]|nr:FAD-dependent oxidoreductase [Clostridiaceae bacterium M8S5]